MKYSKKALIYEFNRPKYHTAEFGGILKVLKKRFDVTLS